MGVCLNYCFFMDSMKHLAVILFFCFSLMGCDNSVDQGKTTNTLSSKLSTLDAKVAFCSAILIPSLRKATNN